MPGRVVQKEADFPSLMAALYLFLECVVDFLSRSGSIVIEFTVSSFGCQTGFKNKASRFIAVIMLFK
jgi:hypothetical protein